MIQVCSAGAKLLMRPLSFIRLNRVICSLDHTCSVPFLNMSPFSLIPTKPIGVASNWGVIGLDEMNQVNSRMIAAGVDCAAFLSAPPARWTKIIG